MDELILKLAKLYHIKIVSDVCISIICSYKSQLEQIAKENDIILTETFKQQFTVQGIFDIRG